MRLLHVRRLPWEPVAEIADRKSVVPAASPAGGGSATCGLMYGRAGGYRKILLYPGTVHHYASIVSYCRTPRLHFVEDECVQHRQGILGLITRNHVPGIVHSKETKSICRPELAYS